MSELTSSNVVAHKNSVVVDVECKSRRCSRATRDSKQINCEQSSHLIAEVRVPSIELKSLFRYAIDPHLLDSASERLFQGYLDGVVQYHTVGDLRTRMDQTAASDR